MLGQTTEPDVFANLDVDMDGGGDLDVAARALTLAWLQRASRARGVTCSAGVVTGAPCCRVPPARLARVSARRSRE
jgi:hypothetical protein